MQISDHIHSLRIPFQIRIGLDKTIDRFVNVFWIHGSRICLIDAGIAGSRDAIFAAIREAGHDPRTLAWLVLTHAHPDHIGGAKTLRDSHNCQVMAHHDDAPWIWDVDRQIRERPVPGFQTLVEGSLNVDRLLSDVEEIHLDDAGTLTALHTPGHSKGHIALFHEPDAVLFTGDAVPVPGQLPIYDDPVQVVRSLRRLRDLHTEGMTPSVAVSSWDEPRRGDEIAASLQAGIDYVTRVHQAVVHEKSAAPTADVRFLTARVLRALALPESLAHPLLFRAIEAHLRAADAPELRAE